MKHSLWAIVAKSNGKGFNNTTDGKCDIFISRESARKEKRKHKYPEPAKIVKVKIFYAD